MPAEYAKVEIRSDTQTSGIARRDMEDREGLLIGLH